MKFLSEILERVIFSTVLVDDEYLLDDDLLLLEEETKNTKSRKLVHLDHVEDLVIRHGREGFDKALDFLHHTHNYLLGKKKDKFNLAVKLDGSPSLIWGHDPDNKKFFVGTKSFFNKTPKVNYNDTDIENNHKQAPGLVNKLKLAHQVLKKISPKDGIYQGDLMYTSDDVRRDGEHYSFTPNTISYNVHKDSTEGKRVGDSKIGIAPHTYYERDLDGQLQAKFGVDLSKFKDDKDIHFLQTKLKGEFNYRPKDQKEFAQHAANAQQVVHQLAKSNGFEAIKNHENLLVGYINRCVREKRPTSFDGYVSFLNSQFKSRMDKLKLDQSKKNLRGQLDDEVMNIVKNKTTFNKIFQVHKHLQDAKGVLVKALSSKSPYNETILGQKSKPEGFVASYDHEPIKLVDRDHFSAANFDWNEKVNPEDNPTVLIFGRFNPPTAGHERLFKTASDVARRTGAKQVTVASKSHDKNRNPLPPSEKMKWLKTMFPGQDIAIAGKEDSTIIAQLQQLHNKGVKHVTVVAGADRTPTYTNLLAKYNGPGKLFHFKKIRVISAGARNSDNNDSIEGTSSTKMRGAAKKNDFKSFKTGLPKHVKDDAAQEMFHVLRMEMGQIQIDNNTPNHSLSIFAKRSDEVGQKAKREIERRKKSA